MYDNYGSFDKTKMVACGFTKVEDRGHFTLRRLAGNWSDDLTRFLC